MRRLAVLLAIGLIHTAADMERRYPDRICGRGFHRASLPVRIAPPAGGRRGVLRVRTVVSLHPVLAAAVPGSRPGSPSTSSTRLEVHRIRRLPRCVGAPIRASFPMSRRGTSMRCRRTIALFLFGAWIWRSQYPARRGARTARLLKAVACDRHRRRLRLAFWPDGRPARPRPGAWVAAYFLWDLSIDRSRVRLQRRSSLLLATRPRGRNGSPGRLRLGGWRSRTISRNP